MPKPNPQTTPTDPSVPTGRKTSAPLSSQSTSAAAGQQGPVCVCEPASGHRPGTSAMSPQGAQAWARFALSPAEAGHLALEEWLSSRPPTLPEDPARAALEQALRNEPQQSTSTRSETFSESTSSQSTSATCSTCEDVDCIEIDNDPTGASHITVERRKPGDTLIGDAPPGTVWPEKELECFEDAPSYLEFQSTMSVLTRKRRLEDMPDAFHAIQAKAAATAKKWWIRFPCLRENIRFQLDVFRRDLSLKSDSPDRDASAELQQLVDDGDLDLPIPAPPDMERLEDPKQPGPQWGDPGFVGPPSGLVSPREQQERGATGGRLGGSAVALAVGKYDSTIDAEKLEGDFNRALRDSTFNDIRVAIKLIRHWLDAEAKQGPQGDEVRSFCRKGKKSILSASELKKRLKLLEKALIEKLRGALMAKNRAKWPETARKNATFNAQDVQADAKLVVEVVDLLHMANGRDLDYLGLSDRLAAVDDSAPSQPKEGEPAWGQGNQDDPRGLIEALKAIEKQLE